MSTGVRVPGPSAATLPRPTYADLVRSEWFKLRSLPLIRRLVLTALLLAVIGSAGFALTAERTTGTSFDLMSVEDQVSVSLLGTDLASITLSIVAALFISSEFSTSMIHLTLRATPRRVRVLSAKLLVLLSSTAVVSVIATLLSYAVGRAILATRIPAGFTLALEEPGTVRTILGTMVMPPFYAVVAAGVATIVRRSGFAFAAVFVMMSLGAISNILPGDLRARVAPMLPSSALHNVSGVSVPAEQGYASGMSGVVVLLTWMAMTSALAAWDFHRRDA
ncbi:MAG: type transport system permease protein [Actinomycetota bacterium]|nr:type transport system permease protein [Actinomycetota bacterium]